MSTQKIYTDTITDQTITYDSNSSLTSLSIYVNESSSCTIQGSQSVNVMIGGSTVNRSSVPISLAAGESVTVGVDSALPMDSITIIATGTVKVIGRL